MEKGLWTVRKQLFQESGTLKPQFSGMNGESTCLLLKKVCCWHLGAGHHYFSFSFIRFTTYKD